MSPYPKTREHEGIVDLVMFPITFGTLVGLVYFTVRSKTLLFHSRLIIGVVVLFCSYLLNLAGLRFYG
jgi:hypothetical protein